MSVCMVNHELSSVRIYRVKAPLMSLVVLFFQAEDGIRDLYVTGVQTCALPISRPDARAVPVRPDGVGAALGGRRFRAARSEERRVGKECRSRWSPYH